MHLNSSFLMVEPGPRVKAQAKVDCCAIKSINHVIDIQAEFLVVKIKWPCFFDQYLGEIGINAPVSLFIGISQGGF